MIVLAAAACWCSVGAPLSQQTKQAGWWIHSFLLWDPEQRSVNLSLSSVSWHPWIKHRLVLNHCQSGKLYSCELLSHLHKPHTSASVGCESVCVSLESAWWKTNALLIITSTPHTLVWVPMTHHLIIGCVWSSTINVCHQLRAGYPQTSWSFRDLSTRSSECSPSTFPSQGWLACSCSEVSEYLYSKVSTLIRWNSVSDAGLVT